MSHIKHYDSRSCAVAERNYLSLEVDGAHKDIESVKTAHGVYKQCASTKLLYYHLV